jgi:hypothetical protein
MVWLSGCLVLALGGLVAWSFSLGQERPVAPPAVSPAIPAKSPQDAKRPLRDFAKLSYAAKQFYLVAQRGAEWLQRANRADGRFGYTSTPALRARTENDPYLRQVGGAFALARAARFFGDDRATALASQAALTLLIDTTVDDPKAPKSQQIRHTTFPATAVNRVAATGLLLELIHELPAPKDDLLERSEQLCNYLRRQQRPDGSLCLGDDANTADGPELINHYSGDGLCGLVRSQRHQPAAWKNEAMRKALAWYQKHWRAHKSMALVPRHTAAYAEAYQLTKDQAYAEFVFEMNDWLCGLQYQQLDPLRPLWLGGFMSWADGKAVSTAPQVSSALYAESLAEACRVARLAGDPQRYGRYRDALERALQFLATLQYTEGNSQHFAEWYRPEVLGAFHASHQDGNLRLDYTLHAVSALVQYLTHAVDPS